MKDAEKISSWVWIGPKYINKCLYERRKEENIYGEDGHVKMEAEISHTTTGP